MEILGHKTEESIGDLTDEKIRELKKASSNGKYDASLTLAAYFLSKDEKATRIVLKYLLLALDQGAKILPYIIGSLYLKGTKGADLQIEPSPVKAFKYFLKDSSFAAFTELRQIAVDNDRMWEKIIDKAKENKLYPVFNDMINRIVETNISSVKIKNYVSNLSDTIDFFIQHRKNNMVKANALNHLNERLVHYTDIKALHSMFRLPEKKEDIENFKNKYPILRLYNVAYMNDPEEGLYLFDHPDLQELIPFLEKDRYYYVYLASFTTIKEDDLTMWRLYGRDGEGMSISFRYADLFPIIDSMLKLCCQEFQSLYSEEIKDKVENRPILYEMKYDCNQVQQEILERLNSLKQAIDYNGDNNNDLLKNCLYSLFAQTCDEIRFLFKSPGYEVEKEYRLLAFHKIDDDEVKTDEREIPHLYVETKPMALFKNSHILIGPKIAKKIDIKLDIEYRLRKYGLENVKVDESKAKYR